MAIRSKNFFSSHVDTVTYDDASGRLSVKYQNGSVAVHTGVPPGVADNVFDAVSIGKALHTHIRGKFPHGYE